ncbi:type II secretion system protein [Massilia sp. TSP1-1-2]|uniref:type II secretion system protein n=1 Tax=unclassified Massilia TaxID=2609279 RepID=UPI003CF20708
MNLFSNLYRQRGVTMVEMIAVIVITGIIGAVVAVFIRLPVQSYTDSVARAAATDVADLALRRITRDLRLALPNSVRVTGPAAGPVFLEFLQTTAGLRYLAEDDVVGATPPVNYLNWNDPLKTSFDVVGVLPADRHAPVVGNFVVVYNLGEGQEPANAYNCASAAGCNMAVISAISGATITMASNPFAAQTASGVALMSPAKRAYVVTSAVTYGCDRTTGKLTRYWNYTIVKDQPTSFSDGNSALLAENIRGCNFVYANLANQRSGLVGLTIDVGIAGQTSAKLTLEHQIHVDNTP